MTSTISKPRPRPIAWLYLFLALCGLGAFVLVNLGIAQHGGFSVPAFVASTWTADFYARSLTVDFWVAAITGLVFVIVEGTRQKMRFIWAYVVAGFLIAFAFSFPLFLFMRELKLASNRAVVSPTGPA